MSSIRSQNAGRLRHRWAARQFSVMFKMKIRNNRYWVSIVVIVSGVACIAFVYFSGIFFTIGIGRCSPPPNIMVDGMATADVITWNDLNGNGIQETGEPPLPWVTVGIVYDYPTSTTDGSGLGRVGKFKPGCACDCWEHESISVVIPPEYQATTATQVELTGQTEPYLFGFKAKENSQLISFPEEPDWYQAFINRGLNLAAFNYSVSTRQLIISFNMGMDQDQEEIYREIFDIIDQLRDSNIIMQQLEITTSSLDRTAICQWETIRQQMGRISPLEIIESHCEHD